MKKIGIGLAVVIVLIAGGVFYVWSNLGSIIKNVVETAGTEVTGVQVSLEAVDVDKLTDGAAGLRGLTVANPKGFKTDYAFKLGEVSVKVDATTVANDVIVIKEVVIAKPQVIYEFGTGGSNIATIQKNVERKVGGGAGSSDGKSPAKSDGSGKKVIIENVYIRGGAIDVSADFLGGKKVGTPLPNIHLKDIGKEGGKSTGASPAEVAEKIIAAISKGATGAVGKINLGSIKDALGGITGTLTKGTSGITKGASDISKEAEKGLKNLFGK
jgi:hypothetical protein